MPKFFLKKENVILKEMGSLIEQCKYFYNQEITKDKLWEIFEKKCVNSTEHYSSLNEIAIFATTSCSPDNKRYKVMVGLPDVLNSDLYVVCEVNTFLLQINSNGKHSLEHLRGEFNTAVALKIAEEELSKILHPQIKPSITSQIL